MKALLKDFTVYCFMKYYDFDDVEPEEESEAQKRIKKISRLVIGLLLIFMAISFILPPHIVGSLLESKRVVNAQIDVNGKRIIFENNAYDRLKEFYLNNQLTELKACLTGRIENGNYFVESFYIPRIFQQTPISVRSEFCNKDTIISLHTHPFNNCLLSYQDVMSSQRFMEMNPGAITAVMCDTDRFAFYGV